MTMDSGGTATTKTKPSGRPNAKSAATIPSTAVKKKSSSKAKKEELIKIVIRRLPPGMGKQELWDQLQPLPANPRAFWLCPANTTEFRPNQAFSRAYIAFHEEKDAIAFAERFNGYVFVDKQGNESMAIVECAPNQHVPKDLDNPAKDSDIRSGTLQNEAKYLKFLDHYNALATAGTRRVTNFEDLVRQLEEKERRLAEGQVQETPLTAFIKHYSAEKMVRKNQQKHLDRFDKRQQKQQSPFSSSHRALGIANEHGKQQPKERKQRKQQKEQQLALAGTGTAMGVDTNKKKNGRAERNKSKQFGGNKTAIDGAGGVEPHEGTKNGKGAAENESNQQTSSYSARVKEEKRHSVDGSKDAVADMPVADGEAKKNAAESGQAKRNAKNRAMLHSNQKFAFFDELEIYREIYACNPSTANASNCWMPRGVFYRISTPFLMQSQIANWLAEKQQVAPADGQSQSSYVGGRKRRRKGNKKLLNDQNDEQAAYLQENRQIVRSVHEQFLSICGQQLKEANSANNSAEEPNDPGNTEARLAVKNAPNFTITSASNFTIGQNSALTIVQLNNANDEGIAQASPQSPPMLIRNDSEHFVVANSCLIPPKSAFLQGDIALISRLPKGDFTNFDIIVVDPPWPNRTVKRQKTYKLARLDRPVDGPLEALDQLELGKMLQPNGLLCLWLTNSPTASKIAHQLLGKWGLRRLAQWHWLKICKGGEPVCQFRPEHKVPFESLLLACHPGSASNFASITDNFCLISIPNANPSRKPPISILLQKLGFIQPVQRGLELFARYLLPNFTSVGFEATKFQNEYFFTKE